MTRLPRWRRWVGPGIVAAGALLVMHLLHHPWDGWRCPGDACWSE